MPYNAVMILPLTRSQEIGIWLRRTGVGILALLAFGIWIVWMCQQSADFKLRVLGDAFERGEERLTEVDRLFDKPIEAVTIQDMKSLPSQVCAVG